MKNNAKIAIIGAGLAGLTAAYRLLQQGMNVEVFEARNRVGGRVFTASMKNYLGESSFVELGAQNITDGGEAKNLLTLCDEFDLAIDSRAIDLRSLICAHDNKIDFQQRLSDYLQIHPTLEQDIDAFAADCQTMAELIQRTFSEDEVLQTAAVIRMSAYEGVPVSQQSIYHNLETFKCMLQGGLAQSHEFYEHEANQIVIKNIREGNAQLPLKIAEFLGTRLHLSKILKKIDKIDDKFTLIFHDGTNDIFDYVILAVPASTYEKIQLSENILVHDRWQKMKSLTYGPNYKIIYPFNLGGKISHRSIITERSVSFFTQNQNLVVLYVTRPIPDLDNELNILHDGYQVAGTFIPLKIEIAQDENYLSYSEALTHNWASDPYAKGSYSGYSTTLSEELDHHEVYQGETFKALFKPTLDGLFFIGEHTTILECVGTMEAAVESGERVTRVFLEPR